MGRYRVETRKNKKEKKNERKTVQKKRFLVKLPWRWCIWLYLIRDASLDGSYAWIYLSFFPPPLPVEKGTSCTASHGEPGKEFQVIYTHKLTEEKRTSGERESARRFGRGRKNERVFQFRVCHPSRKADRLIPCNKKNVSSVLSDRFLTK